MQSMSDLMSVYAAYHRNPTNKAIHAVFVPAIVWTLMVWLDNVPLYTGNGFTLTLGMVLVGALLLWYLMLDFTIGFLAVMLFSILMVSAIQLNESVGTGTAAGIAGIVFVASWIFQFIGHGVWEKRRPALVDNAFQMLVAPSFIVAEVLFLLDMKQELHAEVQEKMQAHLPA